MEQIGHDNIIEQVFPQTHPKRAGNPVENRPLDAHYSGKDNITDSHNRKIGKRRIPLDIIPERHYPVPHSKKQSYEQGTAQKRHPIKDFGKQPAEYAFLHPNIYYVKQYAQQDKYKSALPLHIIRQRKAAGVKFQMNVTVYNVHNHILDGVGDCKTNASQKQPRTYFLEHTLPDKADIRPFPFTAFKYTKQKQDSEQLVNKILGDNRFIRSDNEIFSYPCNGTNQKYDRTAHNRTVFQPFHSIFLSFFGIPPPTRPKGGKLRYETQSIGMCAYLKNRSH